MGIVQCLFSHLLIASVVNNQKTTTKREDKCSHSLGLSVNLQSPSQPAEAFFSWQGARDLEDATKQAAKKVNKNRKEDYKVTFSEPVKEIFYKVF